MAAKPRSKKSTSRRAARSQAKRPRRPAGSKSGASRRAAARPRRPKAAARKPARKPAATRARAAMQGPNAIGCVSQHMDYTSHMVDEVKRFYTEHLGFSNFQHDPSFNYLFIVTGPSSTLGFMPPMPGPPEEWRPPREPAIYLMVENVDRAHAELLAKGVAFTQPPTDMPWMHRVASLRDPEGRKVCLAQDLKR